MEVENVIRLIEAVGKAGLASFEIEEGDFKISMTASRPVEQIVTVQPAASQAVNQTSSTAEVRTEMPVMADNLETVTSPLVGVFYQAPGQSEAPFVRIGDRVKKGQTIGIIEAMKLMNEIPATCDGVIESVLVENEQTVEYGQPLVQIRP